MNSETQHRAEREFRFRPRGCLRFVEAGFLSLWMCGWAAGEAFALFILGQGLWSLLTGRPLIGSDEPAPMVPSLGVGAFLLTWLTLWTFGGLMAIRELLRSLWAEDRLVLERDALIRIHRLGPFASTRRLARSDIRRVFVQSANTALMAQWGANLVVLTDLGTPAERNEAAPQLRAALGLTDDDASAGPAALPAEWQEATGWRGERLLVPNLQTRRKQAIALAIVTGVVWTGLLLLAREALREPGLWAVAVIPATLAAWLARQTVWLFRGRMEWRIEPGRLIRQRRFADDVTERWEARALELTESSDSDGDSWFELKAVELSPAAFARAGKLPKPIRIMHTIRDATEPRCLGQWLSQHAAIPFHDHVPSDADKQAERARMLEQLVNSGKLGRVAGRLLARLVAHTNRRDKAD